ncbi:MAG TPA: hypothetical protein VFO71_03460, partial [Gemmatimonadales bacterium]|nr:hypothetical protein [Gemmatimonadales bacterium]
EVPKVEEEPIPQPGDSVVWTPGMDSLFDSLRAPVETLPPPDQLPPLESAVPPPTVSEPAERRADSTGNRP